jgi:hypothetical protein
MTTACASTLTQDYTLFLRDNTGGDQLLIAGTTLDGFGDAALIGSQRDIAYVTADFAEPGIRGQDNVIPPFPSNLWLWDRQSGTRDIVFSAPRGVTELSSR